MLLMTHPFACITQERKANSTRLECPALNPRHTYHLFSALLLILEPSTRILCTPPSISPHPHIIEYRYLLEAPKP